MKIKVRNIGEEGIQMPGGGPGGFHTLRPGEIGEYEGSADDPIIKQRMATGLLEVVEEGEETVDQQPAEDEDEEDDNA